MSEQKEIGSHIKLCVFSTSEILPVLNVETLDGLEEKIEAMGISETGFPITNKQVKPKYPFMGKVTGHVDLTRVYRVGICLNATRIKGELVQGKRCFGAEAISVMMQRNGLGLGETLTWLEEKIDSLVESGAIYIFKESSTFNMDTATYEHAGYTDRWIITSKHPEQSVDKWNEFLSKKLQSQWRVKSKAVEKLLASRAIAQLLK